MSRGLRNKSFEKLEILFKNQFTNLRELGLLLKYKGNNRQITKQANNFLERHKSYYDFKENLYLKNDNYKRLCQKRQFNPSYLKLFQDLHYLQYEIKTDEFNNDEWALIGHIANQSDCYNGRNCFKFKDYDLDVHIEFYHTGRILMNFLDSRKLGYNYEKMLIDRYKEMRSKLPELKRKYRIYLPKDLTGKIVLTLKKGHLALIDTDFQRICEENEMYLEVYDKKGNLLWHPDESMAKHFETPALSLYPKAPKNMIDLIQDTSLNGYRVPKIEQKQESILEEQSIFSSNQTLIVENLKNMLQELKQMREDYYRFDILRRTIKTKEDMEKHKDKFNLLADHEKQEILLNIKF